MTIFHAAAGRLPDRPSPHLPLPPSSTGYSPIAFEAEIPVWLGHVIAKATSADPGDRYPTPTALGDALSNQDARVGAGLAALTRQQCVLCGALDVLGTAVCPVCMSGSRGADGLVFVVAPMTATERDRALDAAAEMLGADVDAEVLIAVTSGARPLMRVPVEAGPRVLDVLAGRGLHVRVIRERELWRALPSGFQMMVATVLVSGIAAGVVADAWLAAAAAPFALLLVGGGMMTLRRPILAAERQLSGLSNAARAGIAETFAVLPAGPARSLLADIVRRGQAVQRSLTLRQDSPVVSATVDDLLAVACVSARDLAALDETLAQFDREKAREAVDPAWIESLAECERLRDAAVQRLLDAVTVLGRLDVQSARGAEDAIARLGELVAELNGEVKVRGAARDEIEALLAR